MGGFVESRGVRKFRFTDQLLKIWNETWMDRVWGINESGGSIRENGGELVKGLDQTEYLSSRLTISS